MPKLQATYETYNVRERHLDEGYESTTATDNDFEYEVFLWRGLNIVGHFDSGLEPCEHHLSKKAAEIAAKEVVSDVKRGKAADWFSEVSYAGAKR